MSDAVKKTSFLVLLAGILTLLSVILMTVMAGDNPPPHTMPNEWGFRKAILWFELARSPDEIFAVLGDPATEDGKNLRIVMDTMNRYDYGFMVCYSLFNATLFIFAGVLNRWRSRRVFGSSILINAGLILSLAMLLGDALENVQLLKLTGFMTVKEIPDALIGSLQIWTRVKWFSIFLSCLLLGLSYSSYFGRSAGFLLAVCYTTAAISGFFSITLPWARSLAEIASNVLAIAWLISLLHASWVFFKGDFAN